MTAVMTPSTCTVPERSPSRQTTLPLANAVGESVGVVEIKVKGPP